METVFDTAETLEALGSRGITTEAIEALLERITLEQDQVTLGDQETWERLERLRSRWGSKLVKLQAYLA
jgi:hypothetical protein